MLRALIHRLGHYARRPFAPVERAERVAVKVGKQTEALRVAVSALDADARVLRGELQATRRDLNARLLQYHMQLARLTRAVEGREAATLSARVVPTEIEPSEPLPWEPVGDPSEPVPDPEGKEWRLLSHCPVCQTEARTVVNEWNKLLLLGNAPDATAVRYDYAVCHGCGVLYATRRPTGERYRYLLRNFVEVSGKRGGSREMSNPLLNPYPLSQSDRERLRRLIKGGVFVSDHLQVRKSEYLPGLLRDRFENSLHLDVIGSLLSPRNARVLEVRSRAGTILEGLRRLFGASVFAMPIWESQQFILKEAYGIESSALIDFERFAIPFEGTFDLIICNHMLTHVLHPAEFFATLRSRLTPGGHIYLHNEPDDQEFLDGRQSMIATLNPLHMQAFDQSSLVRALGANGFEVVFMKARGDLKHMCLARMSDVAWTPMPEPERQQRVEAYQHARDRALLIMPESLRSRVAEAWPGAVEREVGRGDVEFDEAGRLRFLAN